MDVLFYADHWREKRSFCVFGWDIDCFSLAGECWSDSVTVLWLGCMLELRFPEKDGLPCVPICVFALFNLERCGWRRISCVRCWPCCGRGRRLLLRGGLSKNSAGTKESLLAGRAFSQLILQRVIHPSHRLPSAVPSQLRIE
jgi:hypothetical protein